MSFVDKEKIRIFQNDSSGIKLMIGDMNIVCLNKLVSHKSTDLHFCRCTIEVNMPELT